MEDFNSKIGRRIRLLREKADYTRERLSELSGVGDKFIYEIETGRKGISAETLYKLSLALCTTPNCILMSSNDNEAPSNIIDMLNSLDDKDLKSAEQLLRIYIQAINRSKLSGKE